MDDVEEWRPIEGTEGKYEVSNTGKVRSNNYLRHGGQKELSLCEDQKGYMRTRIFKGKVRTTIKVHREVAKAFIPNPENKPEVNHKDGDKRNNAYWNLEWATPKENTEHAYATGLKEKTRERCRQMGLTIGKAALEREREKRKTKIISIAEDGTEKEYESQSQASKELSIAQSNIHKALNGQRKTAGGYRWRYATRR